MIIPYDYDTACAIADWRDRLVWPVVNHELNDVLKAQSRRYLSLVNDSASEEARNVLLLSAWILGRVRALTIGAYTCDAAQSKGIQFHSVYPEIQFLAGQSNVLEGNSEVSPQAIGVPRWAAIRRTTRVCSWTKLQRIPNALLRPDVMAISHNPVLRDAARDAGQPVGFVHAESILRRAARLGDGPMDDSTIVDLAEMLTDCLTGPENLPDLDHALAQKLEAVVRPTCYLAVSQSRRALARLERLRRIPASLWSGTGGNYSARAVGLEVLRRGGQVTRFSHSGASGLLDNPEMEAITEYSVSSCFITATKDLADNLADDEGTELVKGFRDVRIDAHTGDPSFRQVPRSYGHRGSQPRVVYATTVLSGMRQYMPPVLPDPVYLDWQFRLLEMLRSLPIQLTFKPHPGGLLKGREHPLSESVDTHRKPFETLIRNTSAFVIDYAGTTAFWKALCSGATVVWIDLGQSVLKDQVRDLVHSRCRVIPVTYDGDGKPVIQPEALEEALFTERRDCERPDSFRRILGGEY